jgi:hypothetical protein
MRTALIEGVCLSALLEQCLETRQDMRPQRGKGESAGKMPPGNGHDWYTTGSITGSMVIVHHITIVLRQEWQHMACVAQLQSLPQVEQRLQHGGVRQRLGR